MTRHTSLAATSVETLASDHEEVLRFWFPDGDRIDHATMLQRMEWWFGGGTDAAIAERCAPLLAQAIHGRLDHWARRPRSRLALILVLDQFSRSLYRGTPRAYAQDRAALKLVIEGLEVGHYAALETVWEKTFFMMPLGHSEELRYADTAVVLAEGLIESGAQELRRILEHSASQARGHRDVIARFGRHPHRNAVLGRTSTPEEMAYIARGDFVHLRRMAG
jgi:uncharacterized protein (DUF924 family)